MGERSADRSTSKVSVYLREETEGHGTLFLAPTDFVRPPTDGLHAVAILPEDYMIAGEDALEAKLRETLRCVAGHIALELTRNEIPISAERLPGQIDEQHEAAHDAQLLIRFISWLTQEYSVVDKNEVSQSLELDRGSLYNRYIEATEEDQK